MEPNEDDEWSPPDWGWGSSDWERQQHWEGFPEGWWDLEKLERNETKNEYSS